MQLRNFVRFASLISLAFTLGFGCAPEDEEIDFELPLGQSGEAMTAAGLGPQGLPSSVAGVDTEVWRVTREWSQVSAEAGMAWGASSGLNWEQKYSAWVQSMEETTTHSGGRPTFIVTTPYGKSLPVPYLECAELAMAMRVLFASWHGLPFYMQATDSTGVKIYAGHFGFRTKDGRYKNSARYKANYNDYSNRSAADLAGTWPVDNTLRTRSLYGGQDDNFFIAEGARSGRYFDELLANKRVGYFLLNLLPFFGSINISDDANAWHAKAESVRGGDILLKRWQKQGIGHVMLVKEVQPRAGGKLTATLASGSMPRRQAVWETPASSKMLFTHEATGGPAMTYDSVPYVDLGGGLKRWPSPTVMGGVWRNRVLPADMANFITLDNKTARAARPAIFEDLLVTPSPEVMRDELLAIIESKRDWLRSHPSSCSARSGREEAFEKLYVLMQDKFGVSREQVDVLYRVIDDYAFAELQYEQSRTCCWNSTNEAMANVVLSLNTNRAETASGCVEPLSFMMRSGAYTDFSTHAATMGVTWANWTADESCPQAATVTTDTERPHGWTPWCEVQALQNGSTGPVTDDPFEANDTWQEAATLAVGTHQGARITPSDRDWFRIDTVPGALVRFRIDFTHTVGDLDIEMYEGDRKLDSSSGTSNEETVDATWSGDKPLFVKVIGYRDAQAPYTITVTSEGGVDLGDPCNDNNETMATAFELGRGAYPGLAICNNDVDWFRIPATTGSFVARVEWGAGAGPFQVTLLRSNGNTTGTTNTGNGFVEIESGAGLRFVRVQGTSGSTGSYTLRIE